MNKTVLLSLVFVFIFSFVYGIGHEELIQQVRIKLPLLKDSPVGVIDAEGHYTKGSNNGLNCSGFVKWVVDGFYTPLAKKRNDSDVYMSVVKLREKHPLERGTADMLRYEDTRDPYFGLDWTRNIATVIGKIRKEANVSYKSHDIQDSNIMQYISNCGYSIYSIPDVIREQYMLYPDRLYLGSINGLFGTNPKLWQHYHIALFVPYEKQGQINIIVFERNKETSFRYLWKRYPNTYCHLVWINTNGAFELMSVE